MPASPDILNYYIGKGVLSFTPAGGTARSLGNVPEFEFTPDIEKLDHFSSMAGIRVKDRSVAISKSATVRFIMEEFTLDNLRIALMGGAGVGTFNIFEVSEILGALSFVGTNDVGPQLDINLPLISITPTSSINFLSDEWAGLEVTADVLANPTTGIFGTLTHRDASAAAAA